MMGLHATAKFRWEYIKESGEMIVGAFCIPFDCYNQNTDWANKCARSEVGEEFAPSKLKLTEIPNDKLR